MESNECGGLYTANKIVEDWLACGEILAAQLPSASTWSAEKKLAGAVLAAALVEVRDRHADASYKRRVQEDLQWIRSDEASWPYSFVRLCELFGLEPAYVRSVVDRWLGQPAVCNVRTTAPHRQAA